MTHSPEVQAALDVLEANGWEVRHDRERGHLIGPMLALAYMDPRARPHRRTVVQQPWTEEAP